MRVITLSAKSCMAHLLLRDTFDGFSFIEGEITTFNRFSVDGFLHKDFFDEEPGYDYSYWRDVREFCLSIIRGKRAPLSFKIVLSLAPKHFAAFLESRQIHTLRPEDLRGLYLNFHYDGTVLQCVTGVSLRTFTMDKTVEHEWDAYVEKFFAKAGIEREV